MDSVVMFLLKFGDQTAVGRLSQFDGFQSFVEYACSRWHLPTKDNISFSYCLVGNPRCVLENNDDFLNMSIMVRRAGIDCIQIEMNESYVGESSTSTVCGPSVQPDVDNTIVTRHDEIVPFFRHPEKELLSAKWVNEIQGVGKFFEGGVNEFRIALCKFATQIGFDFDYVKNDKQRVTAQCRHKETKGCQWKIHVSIEKSNGYAYIKKFTGEHTCADVCRGSMGKRISSDLISMIIIDIVRGNSSISPTETVSMTKRDYGLDIKYNVAWRGVEKAKETIFGDSTLSFNHLRRYFEKLKSLDSSSIVVLDYDAEDGHFNRCYVSFGACAKGFEFCRPLIFLDGTFLHGKYKGILLSATAKDGNNGLFPIAFAIVGSENIDNWTWFIEQLRPTIAGRQITFVSDRHPGIISAVKDKMPFSYHSFCMVHMKNNLKVKMSGYGKETKKNILFNFGQCAAAPTEELFQYYYAKILEEGSNKVHEFLDNLPTANYANVYFKGQRYGEMTSNAAESFNAQIKYARGLPITELIDNIRLKLMNQMSKRRHESLSWTSVLCPIMEKRYKKNFDNSRTWHISSSSDHVFEVHSIPSMSVNILECTCSCGKWQFEGFPCLHVVAVLFKTKDKPLDFVQPYFHTDYYQKSYSLPIPSVITFGEPPNIEDEGTFILPPITKRAPGRPKKKRIPSRGEYVTRKMKCGRCGRVGSHNKKTCQETL